MSLKTKKILTKLPSYLVDSWIKRVVDSSSFPSFDDFSEFIKAKAKVANHSLRESVGSSLVCLNKEAEGYRSGSSMLTDAGGACSNSLNLRSHQASSKKVVSFAFPAAVLTDSQIVKLLVS